MEDKDKTKKQLIDELTKLRARIAKSENPQPLEERKSQHKLRKKVEEELEAKSTFPSEMETEDASRLVHELRSHQIELELQNEELRNALDQLEESRIKYSNLYDFAPIGYITLDEHGVIREANFTAARQLDIERDQLINCPFPKYMVIEDADKFHLHLKKIFKNKKRETCDVRLAPKSGGDLWVLLDSMIVQDAEGKVSCRTSIMDITERMRAEEKILNRAAELEAVFAAQNDALLIYDAEMKVKRVNPSFLSIYGFDPVGLDVKEIIRRVSCRSLDGRPFVLEDQPTPRALRGEKVAGACFAITRPDGTEAVVETSSGPMCVGDLITGSVTVWHDITEQKRAEAALRDAHERATWLARFPAENPNPVVRASAEGNVLYRNRATAELPGWTCEFGQQLPDPLLLVVKQAMMNRQEAQHDVELGGRLYSVSVTPFPEEHYANVYGADITERKRMEEEVCRARDELEIRVQERTRELVMAERFILRANRALQTINACNNVLIRDTEELDLLNHVCQIIVEIGGYRMAWVGSAEQDKKKTVPPLAYAGYNEGYLETADISWADTERGRGPTGLAIREGKIHTGRDMQTQPNLGPWSAEAMRRGYASSVALPLTINAQPFGALTIYASEPDAFNEEETNLLASLADNLSYGIAAIRTRIEHRQAEEKLIQAKVTLQDVFDGISDPLLMVDKYLYVRMLNKASHQYFQIAGDKEAIGKTCYELALGRCEPCDNCVINSAILEGKKITFERKNLFDPERIEQVNVYPAHTTVSGISGAIMRISDITESKNMEKHLIRADRLSSLGVLAGGIAHEIRNPLAGINLFIDVLSDAEKFSRSSQELNIFKEIKSNIKKIDGIIKRVLHFSKHSVTISQSKLEVSLLIEDNLKLWRSRMASNGIKLGLFVEENLSDTFGDPIEIQQVLTNLVQNAIEAMEKDGTLRISAENGTLSFDKNRPAVIIRVQDSGPGIPLDQQKSIFNPFFTTKHTGTGLGLAISHRIVSRHGGLMSFESIPNVGTTFTVELPAAPLA